MTNSASFQAILFDLDGTLLDTAPEFTFCLNQMLSDHGRTARTVAQIRPLMSFGSAPVVQYGFQITQTDAQFAVLHQQFLALYSAHLGSKTVCFPGIATVLARLEALSLPWGIVTNKPSNYTQPLVAQFPALARAGCVIAGDTFEHGKPHPLPLRKACEQLSVSPAQCLYVGDAKTDVQASTAAGMPCAVAHYGYIPLEENAYDWQGKYMLTEPLELLSLL